MDITLLENLRCPKTGDILEFDEATNRLISSKAKLAYPIIDNIPMLLTEEAVEI